VTVTKLPVESDNHSLLRQMAAQKQTHSSKKMKKIHKAQKNNSKQ